MSRRRLISLAVVAGGLAVAGGWWFARGPAVPPVPEPELAAGIESDVRAEVAALAASVKAEPRDADRWAAYAQALRDLLFHDEADLCFDTAAALAPGDGRWHYMIASHTADTDPAAAADRFGRAVRAGLPDDVKEAGRLKWVECLLAGGRTADARAALGPDPPASPRAKLAAARVAAAEGDDRAASVLVTRLAAHAAATRGVLNLQADICRRQGRTSYMAVLLERAAAAPDFRWPDPLVDPLRSRTRDRGGRLDEAARMLRSGRPFDAERILLPMTTGDNPDARALVGLAEARRAVGDADGAFRALTTAVKVDPKNAPANYQLGVHHFTAGERLWHAGDQAPARERMREAVGWFDKVLTVTPDFGKAVLLKGVALNRFLGQPDEGLRLIRRYVELRPQVSEGHLLYGQALAAAGRADEAAVELRRAVEMAEPGDRRAADALAGLGQPRPAEKR